MPFIYIFMKDGSRETISLSDVNTWYVVVSAILRNHKSSDFDIARQVAISTFQPSPNYQIPNFNYTYHNM